MKPSFLKLLCFSSLIAVSSTLSAQEEPIPQSINNFGLDLAQFLSEKSDYLVSPASISMALGMTYLGARGETKDEMQAVLHLPSDTEMKTGYRALIDALNANYQNTTVATANKLWPGEGRVELNADFVEDNERSFNSSLESLDFDEPQEAAKTINQWTEEQTNGKIKDLLIPGFVTPDMILILTNAVYFKSNWAEKFDKALTKEGPFTNEKNQKIMVDYMVNNGSSFAYYEDEIVSVLDMPYVDNDFSFTIFLPKEDILTVETALLEIHAEIPLPNYKVWILSMRSRTVNLLQVPKFKTTSKLSLVPTLGQMGMPSAFTTRASFEGIGSAQGPIVISDVVHQTFIEVNEEGTEAAAATAVGAVSRSVPPPPVNFIVDRPFFYALRHTPTNTMLFFGKMSNPAYK